MRGMETPAERKRREDEEKRAARLGDRAEMAAVEKEKKVSKTRRFIKQAMEGEDRSLMQDAIDAAKMHPGLEGEIAGLEQKLLDKVRCAPNKKWSAKLLHTVAVPCRPQSCCSRVVSDGRARVGAVRSCRQA